MTALEAASFRNLRVPRLALEEPVALFWGDNAQGKTNLLEAICVLGTGVSFREKRLHAMVAEGASASCVAADVLTSQVSHRLEVRIGAGGRETLLDGERSSVRQHLEVLPVVTLSAEDRLLVRGEPRARREFLDGTALLIRPAYLRTYQQFQRALRQRNEVLRRYEPSRRGELEAWTKTFVGLSGQVRESRSEAADRVGRILRSLEGEMEGPERLSLLYAPEEGHLPDLLERDRAAESKRGHTLHGPHRDGVELLLGGRPAAAFGSSGQVRTALWMLKLARLLIAGERDAASPVFLLDDAESELDARRIREMMRLTMGRAQVLLTATDPLTEGWGAMQRFRIRAGEAEACSTEKR